jgi:phenylpropionate dioxygenase-like ring-hydroxylating dioxygenase large terminal subunit
VRVPELDLAAFEGVPAPVATVAELRRRGQLPVEAWGRKLVVLWNRGRPRVYEDACPHLGLPLSLGSLRPEGLTCRYHGWTFDPDDGRSVAQPTLRRPQPCALRRWGATVHSGLVFTWQGDPDATDQIRRALPVTDHADFVVHRVVMAAPFYLALFNAIDYAHFARHRFYAPIYALYRRIRRDGHVPGRPFSWKLTAQDDVGFTMSLVEARRELRMAATWAEFVDEGGINQFRTFVTPLGSRRTLYWECYRARTRNPLVRAAAHAAFRSVIVHLLETEDADWTGLSTPNFLRAANIHLSATDAPLGAHLRRFVLPVLEGQRAQRDAASAGGQNGG